MTVTLRFKLARGFSRDEVQTYINSALELQYTRWSGWFSDDTFTITAPEDSVNWIRQILYFGFDEQ